MAAPHTNHKQPEGFVARHPALIGTLFAIAVTASFLGLLISSAGDHAGHGSPTGQHSSVPAGGSAAANGPAPAGHH